MQIWAEDVTEALVYLLTEDIDIKTNSETVLNWFISEHSKRESSRKAQNILSNKAKYNKIKSAVGYL